jgi:hypothetical protein
MQTKARHEMDARSETRDESLNCWKTGSNPQCLRIELSEGPQFLLPYGYFEAAKLTRGGEEERLELQFKSNRFVVKGRGLDELFVALQTLSVEWLRDCPQRYRALAKGQCGVERIESVESES